MSTDQQYIDEIQQLRRERNAVILAHYYQEDAIQDLADHIGDSLQLAQAARDTQADVILFAGVHFMAETARILNPEKIVLIPDPEAGCSLADSCPPVEFRRFKEQYPDHMVLSYINCSAEIKALSDIIVTSSNAERIVRGIPEDQPIIFAPDQNLGAWLSTRIGREMVLWPGSCEVHVQFSEEEILRLKTEHPSAKIIAHPECTPALLRHADFVGSTSALLKYTREDNADSFIVATEPGVIHQMVLARPEKEYVPAPAVEQSGECACNECPYMRMNTLQKIARALRDLEPRIEMDPALMEAARKPIVRMLELS